MARVPNSETFAKASAGPPRVTSIMIPVIINAININEPWIKSVAQTAR